MKSVVGREEELKKIRAAIGLRRNILIEGSVGTGKTFLTQELLKNLKLNFVRVDGDTRYTEQKLTGWFDPPMVLKKGYSAETFVEGPLVEAMKEGKILFINELNRMPEGVQNILLPAMDEKCILLPKLGAVRAKEGFLVIATQNPTEFTATHAISEAIYDRFEMIWLEYQSRNEEIKIVSAHTNGKSKDHDRKRAVDIVRRTREHPSIKRGASVRAAIAICELESYGLNFEQATLMALPRRIELFSTEDDAVSIIQKLLSELPLSPEKKKIPEKLKH